MKKFVQLAISCLAIVLLSSCASPPGYYKTQVRRDLVQEYWLQNINLSDKSWTAHADRWFYTDEPRTFDQFGRRAPDSAAMTEMMVRVPNFTSITVSGPYKVQVYGRQMHNSLFIIGPNNAARHVGIDVNGNSLSIHPANDCKRDICGGQNVTIRVGVRDLSRVELNGNGFIEGKDITSNCLMVKSSGSGEILLSGMMNLQRVVQASSGTTSVIGAYAPSLDVYMPSDGNVNISGHVGIRNIVKKGSGTLNIIGADTDGLKITSQGSGIVAVAGYANLKHVSVTQNSRVYLYWVASDGIYISLKDNARLGLAGAAHNLDIDVNGNARFEGKYLRADNIYVNTRNNSHANVYPQQRLFANAIGYSSIYFFGNPNVVSRYTSNYGVVIPIFNDSCPAMPRTPIYKDKPVYKN